MPQILAIYSHMLTIGYVEIEDIRYLDMQNDEEFLKYIQDTELTELIRGSFIKYINKDACDVHDF